MDRLGGTCFLEDSDVSAKMYGASGVVHQAMEGVIRIMKQQDLTAADIDSVLLVVPPFAERIASFHDPETGEQAKFSLEQAVAGLLVDGVPEYPYIAPFTDAGIRDPRYTEARNRVSVRINESMPNQRGFQAQVVTVILTDGTSHETEVGRLEVAGRSANPLSVEERVAAFRRTAASLAPAQVDRLIDIVMNFEDHQVPEIAETLHPRAA